MSVPTSGEAFRNVSATRREPVSTWPFEALAETCERGLLADWRPVLEEVRARPWGRTARRLERWCQLNGDDAAAAFFTLAVARARERAGERERQAVASKVRAAIERSGCTNADFAKEIGTSASRLSTYATGRVTPSATMMLRIERTADASAADSFAR